MNNIIDNHVTLQPSILLVEDTPSQAMRFSKVLEAGGCHVTWVDTGLQGVKKAHEKPFDLIVLDIELPDINGFEVCQRLKADPKVADIPVVMLTTRDRASDALTGLKYGAVDYIPKDPFAEAVLLATIQQMGLQKI
ncbi:MAG TPA: response regulator [Anaerolineae bacterium]|nr:response regulator [Anaerolineae bacterium]